MTRVPLARPFVEPSLHHFHSSRDPAPGFGSERTHLDRTVRGSRAARCPLEGCVKGWHLMIVNPPSCSLVSAYGPSCTPRFPSLIFIVVPVSGTSSGSPPTNTSDSTRALW